MTQQNIFYFVDLSDDESRLQRFYTLVDTLPKANQDTLERLIFHLAR
jgi:hypothetical protein